MNRRVLRQVTALAATLAASLVLAAAQGNPVDALNSTDPTPADPDLTVGTLRNGLRYYLRQNRRPEQRAVLRLVVNAGSVLEDDDQRGLGHFVEHMAFKGTQHFPKNSLPAFLSSIGSNFGPDANATTNFDETVYWLEVRTDKAALSGALLVLEDWAHHISFESEGMESERGVILEEWRQRLGAAARVRDKETAVLLEGSRYAERIPIGIPDVIRTAAVNRLRRFYTDWYRPDLMAIIAVGDFDVDLVRGLIASRFGHIDPPRRPRARPQYSVPAQSGTRFVIAVDPELPRTTISTTTRLPTRDGSTVGGYRQVIADRLLALLLNARLSEATGHADSGVLRVTVGRRPFMARGHDEAVVSATVRDDRVERAFDTLFAEVERVKRFGFTSTEIDRQRQNALRSAERLATDAGTRLSTAHAEDYVRQFLRNDTIPSMVDQSALFRRFVPDIAVDELNALARTWFSDANRVVVVTGPENPATPLPSEARLAAMLERATLTLLTPLAERGTDTALLSSTPMPGSVGRATYIEGAGLTEWQLGNGVRVVIKPTTVRNDEVLFRASRRGGTSLVDDEAWVKLNGAAQIVGASGAGRYTGLDLRKALTGRIATVTPFLSELEEGLGGSSSPQDLETLFQLIYLRFTQPRKDPAAFALIKDQMKSGILNQTSSPDFLIRNALASALTGDHQRRRALDAVAVDQWDLDRSFAFYKDRFSNAKGFTFVFVGNVDAETLRPLLAQYIATLPSSDEGSMWRDVGVRPPAQVVERGLVKGIEPKSQVAIAFTGPFEYSEVNRLLLRAVAGLLQTRLSEAIREDLGATYSIGVTQTTQPVPYPTYDIRIQWSCAPQRVGDLTRRVFEEVKALTETHLSELVVRSVRTTLEREMQRSLQQNNYVLGQLVLKYQLDLDPAEIWTYPAHLQALTATSIRAATKRYLDPKRYVQVTLMPEDRPATVAAIGRATVPGRDQP